MPKPRRYGFSIPVDAFWLMLVHLVSELRIAVVRAMAELLIRSPTFPLGCVDTYPSIPAHAGIHFHTAPVTVATRGNKRSRTQKTVLGKGLFYHSEERSDRESSAKVCDSSLLLGMTLDVNRAENLRLFHDRQRRFLLLVGRLPVLAHSPIATQPITPSRSRRRRAFHRDAQDGSTSRPGRLPLWPARGISLVLGIQR